MEENTKYYTLLEREKAILANLWEINEAIEQLLDKKRKFEVY